MGELERITHIVPMDDNEEESVLKCGKSLDYTR